ncbi:hypothetical protein D018_3218A, partial [Vibrio parahaemolyticus VP2007-007]
MRITLKQF